MGTCNQKPSLLLPSPTSSYWQKVATLDPLIVRSKIHGIPVRWRGANNSAAPLTIATVCLPVSNLQLPHAHTIYFAALTNKLNIFVAKGRPAPRCIANQKIRQGWARRHARQSVKCLLNSPASRSLSSQERTTRRFRGVPGASLLRSRCAPALFRKLNLLAPRTQSPETAPNKKVGEAAPQNDEAATWKIACRTASEVTGNAHAQS